MYSNAASIETSIRYSDVESLLSGQLDAIQGFEKETLLSLEDAAQHLVNIVPDVLQIVEFFKAICPPSEDRLSIDERASIKLYTSDVSQLGFTSFYIILNKELRSKNNQQLVPWFPYLRLFTSALSKLPSTIGQTVYRGIKLDISDQYPTGDLCVWRSFSSCSSSVGPVKDFLGQTGPRTLFAIKCIHAKNVSQYSIFPEEDEVLLTTGTYFKVVSNIDQGNEFHLIQLEEIDPTTLPAPSRNPQLQTHIDKCFVRSTVDLREKQLTDEDMEIVVKEAIIKKTCAELYLQNNKITPQGVSILALALSNNNTLHKLCLDSNLITDRGVAFLAKILASNASQLKMVGLSSVEATDESAKHLADILQTNNSLTFLRLSHNKITDQGVQLLANVLTHHNNTLESIDISSNSLITDLSIDCLVPMIIRNQRLSSLALSNCGLSEDGKQRFRTMGQSKYGFRLCL